MREEIKAIEKTQTWEFVAPPLGCRPIGLKWVFKVKKNLNGETTRHKVN